MSFFQPLRKLRPAKADLRQLWRSGLLLATSAALGGIAVAIWNRRTLAEIRQYPQDSERETPETQSPEP